MKKNFIKIKLLIFILTISLIENVFSEIPLLLLENPTIYPLPAESDFREDRLHPQLKEVTPHKGLDMESKRGDPVKAAMDGTVSYAGNQEKEVTLPDGKIVKTGWGNYVIIDHGNGIYTLYAHLLDYSVFQGKTVQVGEQIGRANSTGGSTGDHLHFEVITKLDPYDIKKSTRTDPYPHLVYWEKNRPKIIANALLTPGESNLLSMAVARDPNAKYGPQGYVTAGQTLNYTVEFENEGEGIA